MTPLSQETYDKIVMVPTLGIGVLFFVAWVRVRIDKWKGRRHDDRA